MSKKKVRRKPGTRGKVNPERYRVIGALLKRAMDRSEISRRCSAEWGVDRRTIYRYIEQVESDWRQVDGTYDVELERATIRQQLDDIYGEARGSGAPGQPGYRAPDLRACTAILRTKARVLLPLRHEVSGPAGAPIQVAAVRLDMTGLSDEELDAFERITGKLGFLGGDAAGDASGDPGGAGAPER